LEEYTTGVQSLLFELWPCVCATIGWVVATECVLEIIDYLQLAEQRERDLVMGCLRTSTYDKWISVALECFNCFNCL